MNRCLPLLAAGLTLTAASMAYACPDPASGEAYYSHAERAYYLSDGKTYDVAIGGSTPWSSCGISGDGFLPEKASIRLDFNAAEGRSALVQVASGCGMTHMFVHAGDYRGTASGVAGTDPVSVQVYTHHFMNSYWRTPRHKRYPSTRRNSKRFVDQPRNRYSLHQLSPQRVTYNIHQRIQL